NPADDWMGRAFSEVLGADLSNADGFYLIPATRLHALNQALGVRPISAPGISAERTMAMVSGANRIGYGEYAVVGGKLRVRLTIEDPQTGIATQALSQTVPAGEVIQAAGDLARQISPAAQPYTTRDPRALQGWIAALETADPAQSIPHLEEAIKADP